MKTALLGDTDTIALFKLAGVNKSYSDAAKFQELVDDNSIAIILITDEFAEQLKDKIIYHRLAKELPIIIEIPGKRKMEREDTIKRLIMRAVGVEVE